MTHVFLHLMRICHFLHFFLSSPIFLPLIVVKKNRISLPFASTKYIFSILMIKINMTRDSEKTYKLIQTDIKKIVM